MKRLSRYFLEGLLVLVPFVVTIFVIYFIFEKIDSLFQFEIPGTGILLTVLTIFFVGFITSNFITRKIVQFADDFFSGLPMVKMIYLSIKDLLNAFVGEKKGFDRPVRVLLSDDKDLSVVGFLTNESLNHLGIETHVAVYLPQSYNFAGNLILVSPDRVIPLNAETGDVMAFVVSGGVSARAAS